MYNLELNDIKIGSQIVGASHPPLILPDIDMFFNGNLSVAEELVDVVKAAGLTTIKAAILEDRAIVFDDGAEETYLDNEGQLQAVNYRELIQKKVLSREQHIELFDIIRREGLQLVVSVYEIESVQFAIEQGAVAIKIPSSNITHEVLIKAVSACSVPLILDTGKATLEEISRAVDWARIENNDVAIIVEHSPLAPPAPIERQDLRMIPHLRNTFGLHTGLSHHARGSLMMLASVPLGATVIECGLCRDGEDADQDVYHALCANELKPAVSQINEIHSALGDPFNLERHDVPFHRARMSLRAKNDLPIGTVLGMDTVSFSFPPIGIPAERWSEVVGRTIGRPVKGGNPVNFDDLN
jgi:sialic acid synthase SpsE